MQINEKTIYEEFIKGNRLILKSHQRSEARNKNLTILQVLTMIKEYEKQYD